MAEANKPGATDEPNDYTPPRHKYRYSSADDAIWTNSWATHGYIDSREWESEIEWRSMVDVGMLKQLLELAEFGWPGEYLEVGLVESERYPGSAAIALRPEGSDAENVLMMAPRVNREELEERDRDDDDAEESDSRLPTLPWCGDCWDQIGENDTEPPEECPECGSTDTFRL